MGAEPCRILADTIPIGKEYYCAIFPRNGKGGMNAAPHHSKANTSPYGLSDGLGEMVCAL